MKLREIPAERYAQDVLPQTAALWAGSRDYETYVAQTLEIAASGYGRRHVRFVGLYDGDVLLASCKVYARQLSMGTARLQARGFGAVFTEPALRGRGYASAMIAMLLDAARDAGVDVAYLFSDIRPQFYADLGFHALPSRRISLRADALSSLRVEVSALDESAWPGVRRCFDARERLRTWHFTRTPLVWEWIRLRMRQGWSERANGIETNLVVHRGKSVAAYIFGARSAARDMYVLDEFGYCDDEAASLIPALLRSAAGDLRRITGWLPPEGARSVLPRGSVKRRTDAIFMAAPLSPPGRTWYQLASLPQLHDGVWEFDHI